MRRSLVLAALVLASCGGQQATTTAVTLPTPSASASPIATDAPPDVSPVPAPEGLIGTMRLSRPRHTLDQWSSLVSALGAPKLAVNLDDIAKDELGAHVVDALDLDAPIDILVMKVPGAEWVPGGAASVAINPGDAAMDLLAHGFQLEQKSDGSIAIRKQAANGAPPDEADAGDDEIADDTRCIVAPPVPSTPRRMVCVYGGVEFAAVVPYLTRTLARQTASQTSDFRAEVFLDKQRDSIRKLEELAKGSTSSANDDPAEAFGASLATDMSKTFVDDLDAISFDVTSEDDAVSFSFSARFGRSTSPITRMVLSNGDGAPPQAAFWQLPNDTSLAMYTHGATAKDLDPLREQIFTGLKTMMTTEGSMPKSGIELLDTTLRSVFLTGGPEVIGGGFDVDGARNALAAYVALGKDTLAARTKARAAMQGWTLFEVDEPASRWTDAMKSFVALDKIPTKKKPSKSGEPETEKSTLVATPVPAALGLPAGTFHLEQRSTPLPPPPKKAGDTSMSVAKPKIANTTHIFVVPDGGSTWIAMGEDAKLVAAHLKAALASAPSSGTMKGRAGVERLANLKTTSGLFATLAWGVLAFSDDTSDSDLKDASTWLDKLSRWPARGMTPMETYVTPIPPTNGGLGGRTITFRLPRAALGDIVKAF